MARSDTPGLLISGRATVPTPGLASQLSDCDVRVSWVKIAPMHDNDAALIWIGGPETCAVVGAERGRSLDKTGTDSRRDIVLENLNLMDVWIASTATGDGVEYVARV